jgi:hypothetical protein
MFVILPCEPMELEVDGRFTRALVKNNAGETLEELQLKRSQGRSIAIISQGMDKFLILLE